MSKKPDWLVRLDTQCTRAEQEFPRLAAPDGTVSVNMRDLRKLLNVARTLTQ